MAQKVTALAALAEDTDAIPSNQMAAHNHLEPQFQGTQYSLLVSTDTAIMRYPDPLRKNT